MERAVHEDEGRENMKWISVKDELPIKEDDEFDNYYDVDVIVFADGFVETSLFEAGRNPDFWFKWEVSKVTHWMPLPDGPK